MVSTCFQYPVRHPIWVFLQGLFVFALHPDAHLKFSPCFTIGLFITCPESSSRSLNISLFLYIHGFWLGNTFIVLYVNTFSVQRFMYPRTDPSYCSRYDPSANKSHSVLWKHPVALRWLPQTTLVLSWWLVLFADPWSVSWGQRYGNMVWLPMICAEAIALKYYFN